jgi:hypothetical protein
MNPSKEEKCDSLGPGLEKLWSVDDARAISLKNSWPKTPHTRGWHFIECHCTNFLKFYSFVSNHFHMSIGSSQQAVHIPYLQLMFNTKQFTKGLVRKKEIFCWYLLQLLKTKLSTCEKNLLSQPLGYSYKHTIQCVFCMQSLKFWKIQFETTEPGFLRKLKFGKEVPILNSRYGNSSFRS